MDGCLICLLLPLTLGRSTGLYLKLGSILIGWWLCNPFILGCLRFKRLDVQIESDRRMEFQLPLLRLVAQQGALMKQIQPLLMMFDEREYL